MSATILLSSDSESQRVGIGRLSNPACCQRDCERFGHTSRCGLSVGISQRRTATRESDGSAVVGQAVRNGVRANATGGVRQEKRVAGSSSVKARHRDGVARLVIASLSQVSDGLAADAVDDVQSIVASHRRDGDADNRSDRALDRQGSAQLRHAHCRSGEQC